MNDEKRHLIKQFNRYIKNVIMPMFPQLIDFKIRDWFPENNYAFEFDFFYNEYPDEFVNIQIEDSIREMMKVFSIETIVYGVNFKLKD